MKKTILLILLGWIASSFAQVAIPGSDVSGRMEAAGTLLRFVDVAIFVWGARIFAALCIASAGWALKEQRFGVAVLCILAAFLIATTPKWVKNMFDISGSQGIFGQITSTGERNARLS